LLGLRIGSIRIHVEADLGLGSSNLKGTKKKIKLPVANPAIPHICS